MLKLQQVFIGYASKDFVERDLSAQIVTGTRKFCAAGLMFGLVEFKSRF